VAYDYYLKGRDYYNRLTKDDNERAIELFEKALEIDPNYALAHAGIAMGYGQRPNRFGFADTWNDSARAAAQKALEIDPDLAEAHVALGLTYMLSNQPQKALEAFHRAVDINPNHAGAAGSIGVAHAFLFEIAEAFRWYKRSVALDPMRATIATNLAGIYQQIGDYASAEKWLNRALEVAPDYSMAEFNLAYSSLMQGRDREAIARIEKAMTKYPDNIYGLYVAGFVMLCTGRDAQAREYNERLIALAPGSFHAQFANMRLGYLQWKAGQKEEAKKRLSDSLAFLRDEIAQGGGWMRYDVASVYAVQGETDRAIEWLQRAVDGGYVWVERISIDPLLDTIREDARFKEIVAHLEIKVAEIRREIEAME
jgi:protein kinase/serine/threonine-protein kinase